MTMPEIVLVFREYFIITLYAIWLKIPISKTFDMLGNMLTGRYLSIFIFHRRCSVRTSNPRNFAKFLGKHVCQSLFFKFY